jgi:mannose-6-phosphate isomerase-like protein (cupin superfamily)
MYGGSQLRAETPDFVCAGVPMSEEEIDRVRADLVGQYPGAQIKVAPDGAEMVAEIEPERAVAVIERSQAHFHSRTVETYRVLRGRLYVSSGGRGHVLEVGDSLVIEPGNVHSARGADGLAWVEVLTEPAWSVEDHHVL